MNSKKLRSISLKNAYNPKIIGAVSVFLITSLFFASCNSQHEDAHNHNTQNEEHSDDNEEHDHSDHEEHNGEHAHGGHGGHDDHPPHGNGNGEEETESFTV